jgi:hypothetical protein
MAPTGVSTSIRRLIPTVGVPAASSCSLFERPASRRIAHAPTYAGFLACAMLNRHAAVFSVEMDREGSIVARVRSRFVRASAGYFVPSIIRYPTATTRPAFRSGTRRARCSKWRRKRAS